MTEYLPIISLFVFAALWGFLALYNYINVRKLRSRGLYPEAGKATMQHVENLIRSGNEVYAMRAYREVHPSASLRQAKEAVEAMSMPHNISPGAYSQQQVASLRLVLPAGQRH